MDECGDGVEQGEAAQGIGRELVPLLRYGLPPSSVAELLQAKETRLLDSVLTGIGARLSVMSNLKSTIRPGHTRLALNTALLLSPLVSIYAAMAGPSVDRGTPEN